MVNYPSEKIWQSGDRTPTTCQPVQPSVRPHHRYTNTKFWVVHGKSFFLSKTNGNLRFVKHKQLRSSGKSTLNKKKFFHVSWPFLYICIFNIIYLFCPLLHPFIYYLYIGYDLYHHYYHYYCNEIGSSIYILAKSMY